MLRQHLERHRDDVPTMEVNRRFDEDVLPEIIHFLVEGLRPSDQIHAPVDQSRRTDAFTTFSASPNASVLRSPPNQRFAGTSSLSGSNVHFSTPHPDYTNHPYSNPENTFFSQQNDASTTLASPTSASSPNAAVLRTSAPGSNVCSISRLIK